MSDADKNLTRLLQQVRQGNEAAREQVLDHLYGELRARARAMGARGEDTICPTVLVHDAYLQLTGSDLSFRDRFHFMAMMSKTMKHILIDHARARAAVKRGGALVRVSLEDNDLPGERAHDLIRLTDALELLEKINPRQSRIIEQIGRAHV